MPPIVTDTVQLIEGDFEVAVLEMHCRASGCDRPQIQDGPVVSGMQKNSLEITKPAKKYCELAL